MSSLAQQDADALPDSSGARSAGRRRFAPLAWLRERPHVWIPCLVLLVFTAPSVSFLLPATQDYLHEIYQPLQALKFFKTRGQAYHKYGPLPNFVLAPGYGASLVYWKLTGQFGRPSEDFPYGFEKPFRQMSVLIFQGRLLFLTIAVIAIGYLAHTLRYVTESKLAIGAAIFFCVATNHALTVQLPSPRPDSPMLAFSALALALYVKMLYHGLTVRRGVWMSIWAACAVSSKELAGPMFVLPYLALIWIAWREGDQQPGGRRGARLAIRWTFLSGLIAYALINVVYAPRTWLQRMDFWLRGPGIDAEVWGSGTLGSRLFRMAGCLLDNFGPGGIAVVVAAMVFLLVARPPRWVLLLLPAISVTVLGLAKIQYPASRFYTILCLALVPVVAAGLAHLFRGPLRRAMPATVAAIVLLGAINFWWCTFTWHSLRGIFEYQVERHALANVSKQTPVNLFFLYPWNKGSTRLEWLGFNHDPRSIQQLAAQRTDLPEWIYATRGRLLFVEHARDIPKRAEMLRSDKDSPFEINTWQGLEGLGYHLEQTSIPQTPGWFPFDWMPAVREWQRRHALLVYRRKEG